MRIMKKLGGLVLIAAAVSLSACSGPAEAVTTSSTPGVNWERAEQANPELVAKIKTLCDSISTATNVDGADAATVKRLAQEYCPR